MRPNKFHVPVTCSSGINFLWKPLHQRDIFLGNIYDILVSPKDQTHETCNDSFEFYSKYEEYVFQWKRYVINYLLLQSYMDVVNAPFEKYFQHVAFSAKMKYILRIFARLLIVACLYMGFGYTWYVPDRTKQRLESVQENIIQLLRSLMHTIFT